MIVWPVIERELRAEARHRFTYGLRLLGAGWLAIVAIFFALDQGDFKQGRELFCLLQLMLLVAIWIVVPLVTADCISRERREGTLGLLFLTSLKAHDIVLAKTFVHGLRALAAFVAVIPVLVIPLLMGGVSWQEAVLCGLADASSFCWALAAGLLASSRSRAWLRSLTLAAMLGFIFLMTFCFVYGALVITNIGPLLKGSFLNVNRLDLWQRTLVALASGLILNVDWDGWRGQLLGQLLPSAQVQWIWAAMAAVAVSMQALLIVVAVAARTIRSHWQDEPPSARQLWWERIFCTPVIALNLFHRWMRHKLERNPVGWLEQRTWTSRVVTWSWLAVMVSVLSLAVSDAQFYMAAFRPVQSFMAFLLAGSMALSAAGSFRRERESGVLELLLVSPLSVAQIIGGRLRGLGSQFLPAIVLLFGVWLYFRKDLARDWEAQDIWFFSVTFATLPVVGLYFSLRRGNFLSAFLFTVLFGIFLPTTVPDLAELFLRAIRNGHWLHPQATWSLLGGGPNHFSPERRIGLIALTQIALALALARRLHRKLTDRSFALDKSAT